MRELVYAIKWTEQVFSNKSDMVIIFKPIFFFMNAKRFYFSFPYILL